MNTEPMKVKNISFLLERVGRDCAPLQYVRELTHNAIEAVLRSGKKEGTIIWDIDDVLLSKGIRKLCITDNGDGMTALQMVEHINGLSSSGAEQSFDGNYGLGAKIAAGVKNPNGLIYQSWRGGNGHMIRFWKDPETNIWGLFRFNLGDGIFSSSRPVAMDETPAGIGQEGTRVILLGSFDREDTTEPPKDQPGGSRAKNEWMVKYLNSRYFAIPEHIEIKVRGGLFQYPEKNSAFSYVTGMRDWLQKKSLSSGSVLLTGARAHWWILKPVVDHRTSDNAMGQASRHDFKGHVAALYKNELYEMERGNAGKAKLNDFGILFRQESVVLYLEPDADDEGLTTNAARTQLLYGQEPLPWSDWAVEFRLNMPPELLALENDAAKEDGSQDLNAQIREHLHHLLHLYKVTKRKVITSGSQKTEPNELMSANDGEGGTIPDLEGGSGDLPPKPRRQRRRSGPGGIYGDRDTGELPSQDIRPDPFPTAKFADECDVAKDRAAIWAPKDNLIKINRDFQPFKDLEDTIMRDYFADRPTLRDLVKLNIHKWVMSALIEAVMGAQALVGRKDWTEEEIKSALSPEALTSVVMPRYHVLEKVKRAVTNQAGGIK